MRYSVTMRTIQYGLVNSAMGQIPCSTERISCLNYYYYLCTYLGLSDTVTRNAAGALYTADKVSGYNT